MADNFLSPTSKTALWLAFRELLSRKPRFFASIALVAIAVALCVATELVSRAREVALSAEIDQIGPAIQLIPAEVSQTDLMHLDLKEKYLESTLKADVQSRFSSWIRALEGRLILNEQVDETGMPVIGIETQSQLVSEHGVALGAVAATQLRKRVGDKVAIRNIQLSITAVLPTVGTTEDLAIFTSRERLKALTNSEAVNEIRLFLLPERNAKELGSLLQNHYKSIRVIVNDRGSVADRESADALRKHRHVVYVITSVIVAVSLLIGAFLNFRERMNEMATLIAIGGTELTVFYTLTLRAVIVSFLGGIFGYGIGILVASAQGIGGVFLLRGSWDLFLIATLAPIVLSILVVGSMVLVIGARAHDSVAVWK